MKHGLKAAALAAAVVILLGAGGALAKTQVFLETNEDQFAQGHAEGVVWTSLGTLRLGRAVESLLAETPGVDYVARLVEAPDGTVYAITGGAGRIYRIKDKKATLYATLTDKFLFSAAVDKNGDLYVGSGGTKGRIWRIEAQAKGEPKIGMIFEADDVKYVWDLAWMKDGALAAATGDKGKLLRVTTDGKSEVLIKSEANHILCLAVGADGAVYAGTDGEAVVYRYANKNAFVLYDADEPEVTALAVDAVGNLYVGTSSGGAARTGGVEMPPDAMKAPAAMPPSGGPVPGTTPSAAPKETPKDAAKDAPKTDAAPASEKPKADENAPKPPDAVPAGQALATAVKVTETMQAARASGSSRPATPGRSGGAVVYRITPQGIVSRVFEPRDAMILSLALSDERLLVATGKNARLYEVGCTAEEEEACVASIDPKQAMALAVCRDGRVLVGAAGPGRVYALSKGYAKEGAYTSQVYDAGGSARWGSLDWRSRAADGGEVLISTRTGNVRDPEKGMWSEWSKPAAKPLARVESPPARFIQFRVTMKSRGEASTPVLEQYEAAYLRVNEPPKILSIGEVISPDQAARAQAVERFKQAMKSRTRPPTGGMPQQPPIAAPPPPAAAQPIRTLQWQAQDPNQDSLRYDLYFRGQGEPTWVLIEKDILPPQFAWDTGTVADGWYEIKVVASDRTDNPPETALEDSKISDPILVDNTAPLVEKVEIQAKAGGEAEVRFTARDTTSRITEASYTVDSALDWKTLAPSDGLFDAKTKEFKFTIRHLTPGPHRLAIRVVDEAQNAGNSAHTLTAEK